jgi:uncharacterized protein HemY
MSVSGVDYGALLEVAQHHARQEPNTWWVAHGPGAVLYRMGRYREAQEALERTRKTATQMYHQAAQLFWLALTYHQLGQKDLAGNTLAEAVAICRTWAPRPGEVMAQNEANEWIECHLIRLEAEKVIQGEGEARHP